LTPIPTAIVSKSASVSHGVRMNFRVEYRMSRSVRDKIQSSLQFESR
jgi:hypothetical protein